MTLDGREKRIAVVGVSKNERKFGHRIFRDLLAAGYIVDGKHPASGEVAGKVIHKRLTDLDYIPDLVVTVVPPNITAQIVEDCHRLGIKEIWMQPGSESQEAVDRAGTYGISVHYDACIMVEYGIW